MQTFCKRLFWSLLVLFAGFSSVLSAAPNEEVIVSTVNLRHSYVDGYYDFTLTPNPVRSRTLRVTATCPDRVWISSVQYISEANQAYWETTSLGPNGTIRGRKDAFYGLRLNFYAPGHYTFTCTWTIYATKSGDPENPGNEELAGVLRYNGGYAERLTLNLSASRIVSSFRVAVPSYCKNVDILEAGTVSDQIFDAAKLSHAGERTYLVNEGAGMRISAIATTLNGPEGKACVIPVYINKK